MRLALGIEYDGSAFHGWQRQATARSVQGCLEGALARVAAHSIAVVCAGRTDAGVHATGQVVHFDTKARRATHNWVLGGNANLPADVRIRWAQAVSEEFHARFSARARRYHYYILCAPTPSALLRQRTAWCRLPLNLAAMQEAASHLVGEHDFSSFRAAACQARHPRRRITEFAVRAKGPLVILEITANAFLQHMVRNIAGLLLLVGRGEQPAKWAGEVLAARDRTRSAPTAPAQGLCLVAVSYPQHFALPEHAPYSIVL